MIDRGHLEIGIASDRDAKEWSHGEVTLPETLNYRTYKPFKHGLFCEEIFGPVKDYECACGTYNKWSQRGTTCEKCGVLVGPSSLRRERMGHIELALPIVHIWYSKIKPSVLGALLDMKGKELDSIVYCEVFVVTKSDIDDIKIGKTVPMSMYSELKVKYGKNIEMQTGAEAIAFLLHRIRFQLPFILEECRDTLIKHGDDMKPIERSGLARRIHVLEILVESKVNITNIVKNIIPVLPPELRPMKRLPDGRFTSSDLNELYKSILTSNIRLKRMISMNTPEVMILGEQAILQKNVDALFDNQRGKRKVTSSDGRLLTSLSGRLQGKRGRFRQNLLGKRVDYSGRSVIVVNPELKLNQCGLPKYMALELFKPFVIGRLVSQGYSHSIKNAKQKVEHRDSEVWDVLEDVSRENVVLLNRAPTLHKLGIQAFEPLLVEGKAIQLHPLVCVAFNADFDGDQMAVHVPLTKEAQKEARTFMMATENIKSPASGEPIMVPNQDIVLGLYYLTQDRPDDDRNKRFISLSEVHLAYESDRIGLSESIDLRLGNETYKTTPGRVMLYEIMPSCIDFDEVNKTLNKSDVINIIDKVYLTMGIDESSKFVDELMAMGIRFATQSGCSISVKDFIIPDIKGDVIDESLDSMQTYEDNISKGLMTKRQLSNMSIDMWTKSQERIAEAMIEDISGFNGSWNSVWIYSDSGARGSVAQIQQMAGMRGLISRPNGTIMETPIISNFREGLSVDEYFLSTHGTRKGLCDTALKTAQAGYLTRRLVDMAQDVIITEKDCGTERSIELSNRVLDNEVNERLSSRLIGRTLAEDITVEVPNKRRVALDKIKEITFEKGTLIDAEIAEALDGHDSIPVRSPVLCESKYGICAYCYGADIATGQLVEEGSAVGIVAAQSIGEPGTQLTLRTFHTGGSAEGVSGASSSTISAKNDGKVDFIGHTAPFNNVCINRSSVKPDHLIIRGRTYEELERHALPYGARLKVKAGTKVRAGDILATFKTNALDLLAEYDGIIAFENIDDESVESITEVDELTGIETVTDTKVVRVNKDLPPTIYIESDDGTFPFYLPVGSILKVQDGDSVRCGDILCTVEQSVQNELLRTQDIVGGLERVEKLFECRMPKIPQIISPIAGTVDIYYREKENRVVVVSEDEQVHFDIPKYQNPSVFRGEYVEIGDVLAEGEIYIKDVISVYGIEAFTAYMETEIQNVYRRQGISLKDIHIEVIVRQMIQNLTVTDPGSTRYVSGDVVSFSEMMIENSRVRASGGTPAEFERNIMGLTDKSKHSDSFICAAAFQETAKALTTASISGKIDELKGIKENVIVGNLIPAGTGYSG